jgi:hypothetical protein
MCEKIPSVLHQPAYLLGYAYALCNIPLMMEPSRCFKARHRRSAHFCYLLLIDVFLESFK